MSGEAVHFQALEPHEDYFARVEVPQADSQLEAIAVQRRQWARHAMVAGTSMAATGIFIAVSRGVSSSPRVRALDHFIGQAVESWRRPILTGIARDFTSLGGVTLATVTTVTAMALTRRSRFASLQIALGALGGLVADLSIKAHFARPRPQTVLALQDATSWSYPSGHSLASASTFLTLAFVGSHFLKQPGARVPLLASGAALATVVGATRIYLGVHHPTDVVGGLALGTAWACLLEAVFDYVGARKLDEHRRERRRLARAAAAARTIDRSR